MVWLKKEILFILSTILITLSSCGGQEKLQNQKEERKSTKEELISAFFEQIQSWNKNNISVIDSLGRAISHLDSSLSFLPLKNDYEPRSFVFTTNDKQNFLPFEESDYLIKSDFSQQSSYKVWRKQLNELQTALALNEVNYELENYELCTSYFPK